MASLPLRVGPITLIILLRRDWRALEGSTTQAKALSYLRFSNHQSPGTPVDGISNLSYRG